MSRGRGRGWKSRQCSSPGCCCRMVPPLWPPWRCSSCRCRTAPSWKGVQCSSWGRYYEEELLLAGKRLRFTSGVFSLLLNELPISLHAYIPAILYNNYFKSKSHSRPPPPTLDTPKHHILSLTQLGSKTIALSRESQ